MCDEDIRNEVKRYITWPGQACGYKVGQLKIKELRQRAEKELGMCWMGEGIEGLSTVAG